MKKILLLLVQTTLILQTAFAQDSIPVLKANSQSVNARVGEIYVEGVFTIPLSQEEPLRLNLPYNHEKVTFYTDIDSIKFEFNPNKIPEFIILLNNKDSSFYQIAYQAPPVDYLTILKNGGTYNFSDNRAINEYLYKSPNDPELKLIREKFNLDSIAGTGNEISKLINILRWVHNTFPHDGTKEVPKTKGIAELMISVVNNGGTMHCGALTWALNDCYAALGYKSRQVMCMPKDSLENETHSINSVYSHSLNKWIWMDPTNFAYVMNENGELLSIAEVRERLVDDKPLILNPDANWNNTISVVKAEYLDSYMAKNLYAIQCWSVANGVSKSNLLLPLAFEGVYTRTAKNKPKITNNPNVFWRKPN